MRRAPDSSRFKRVLDFAVPDRRGSHHQRAIGHGLGHALELLGVREDLGSADGRARLAKGRFERIDDAQVAKSKVAHGASSRANVQRIARGHQNDTEAIGFGWSRHAAPIVRQACNSGDWRVSRRLNSAVQTAFNSD